MGLFVQAEFAQEDFPDPEAAEIPDDVRDAWEVEELRLAVGALVVVYGHLDDSESGPLNLGHHLGTDDAAVAFEGYGVEDAAPYQSEVAVHIAKLEAECEFYRPMIDAAYDDPVKRIVALNFVALDYIHLGARVFEEQFEFADVVLGVAVGVEDPFFGARSESASERSAVALVGGVPENGDLGKAPLDFFQ